MNRTAFGGHVVACLMLFITACEEASPSPSTRLQFDKLGPTHERSLTRYRDSASGVIFIAIKGDADIEGDVARVSDFLLTIQGSEIDILAAANAIDGIDARSGTVRMNVLDRVAKGMGYRTLSLDERKYLRALFDLQAFRRRRGGFSKELGPEFEDHKAQTQPIPRYAVDGDGYELVRHDAVPIAEIAGYWVGPCGFIEIRDTGEIVFLELPMCSGELLDDRIVFGLKDDRDPQWDHVFIIDNWTYLTLEVIAGDGVAATFNRKTIADWEFRERLSGSP